jgi:drug/metabolite transporter (DMT)-like permease
MALAKGEIDAATFTTIRLISGATMLGMLLLAKGKAQSISSNGNWPSAFFLFAYASAFSFAYIGLSTGTGALILFGSVQLTMFGLSIYRGVRPAVLECLGLIVAFGGLIYLVFPGLAAPPLMNAIMMAAAGIAWGFYTLRGKGSVDPLPETAGNFLRSVPMVLIVGILSMASIQVSVRGATLAAISGAIASGIGYAFWYAALKHHAPTRAGILQLSVPVLAAVGGILLLAETTSTRILIAGALVLGGIGLTFLNRNKIR